MVTSVSFSYIRYLYQINHIWLRNIQNTNFSDLVNGVLRSNWSMMNKMWVIFMIVSVFYLILGGKFDCNPAIFENVSWCNETQAKTQFAKQVLWKNYCNTECETDRYHFAIKQNFLPIFTMCKYAKSPEKKVVIVERFIQYQTCVSRTIRVFVKICGKTGNRICGNKNQAAILIIMILPLFRGKIWL